MCMCRSRLWNLDTEDYFHRQRLPAAVVELDLRESSLAESAKKRLEEFVERSGQRETPV